jgi:uncharacterized protein YjbI with pentapeptide repeats
MRPVGLLQHAISLTWILLILGGCAIPPERSTASPSATAADAQPTTSPTPEEVEYCKLIMLVTVEAYIDHNENGKREAWEDPLQDARFRVEWRNPKESPESGKEAFYVESDATGQAQYDVLVDCLGGNDDLGTVYAEVLPDYKITTSDRCRPPADCIFGFAALNVTPIRAREGDLRGADLHGADLRGEDLRDADLTGANLREADLRGAILCDAELSGADLQEADLSDADLTGTNLREANLRGAKLRNAELSGADLQGVDLSGADLRDANISNAKMSGAILVEANLIGADLSSADLSGADMSQAHLFEADLRVTKYDRYTRWPEGFDPVAAGAVLEE